MICTSVGHFLKAQVISNIHMTALILHHLLQSFSNNWDPLMNESEVSLIQKASHGLIER